MTYTFPEYTYTFRQENGKLWVNDKFIARRSSWGQPWFARDGAIWYIRSQQSTPVSEIRNSVNALKVVLFFPFYINRLDEALEMDPGIVTHWFNGKPQWRTSFVLDRNPEYNDIFAFWEKKADGWYFCQESVVLGPFRDQEAFIQRYPEYQNKRLLKVVGNRYAYPFRKDGQWYFEYQGIVSGPFRARPDVFLGPDGRDLVMDRSGDMAHVRGLNFSLDLEGLYNSVHDWGGLLLVSLRDADTGLFTVYANGRVYTDLPKHGSPQIWKDDRFFELRFGDEVRRFDF